MELVYKITYHRMKDHYLPKLVQAIRFVSEDELWKEGASVNSIGGIVLHICEHIQRNYHLGQVVDRTKFIKGRQFNFCQNGINEKNLKTRVETSKF
ncbi:hypothetical protein [Bacillus cereus]|uniref:hypothetical protein n=1 Tax=Bacillus cereus TaxID=1396 RepID=UPI00099519E5|nr:hypothetical protein [Bacillus cereus]OOZ89459.1 hypothetical protein BHL25_06435 [Bacillus cereus]